MAGFSPFPGIRREMPAACPADIYEKVKQEQELFVTRAGKYVKLVT
ncbi:MAG: hypothetical protein ACOYBL_10590 [Lachnospiraceae bacterium]|jgi:hypothetical protein